MVKLESLSVSYSFRTYPLLISINFKLRIYIDLLLYYVFDHHTKSIQHATRFVHDSDFICFCTAFNPFKGIVYAYMPVLLPVHSI